MQGLFMNKLKFVKIVVFLLTFAIVFLLCLGMGHIMKRNSKNHFTINLELAPNVQIKNMVAEGDYLFVASDEERIYVIDVQKGKTKGEINLVRSVDNGKKE